MSIGPVNLGYAGTLASVNVLGTLASAMLGSMDVRPAHAVDGAFSVLPASEIAGPTDWTKR